MRLSVYTLAVFMVCRDNVEDPLDDTGTVQQQLDQVNLFCFVFDQLDSSVVEKCANPFRLFSKCRCTSVIEFIHGFEFLELFLV